VIALVYIETVRSIPFVILLFFVFFRPSRWRSDVDNPALTRRQSRR